MRFTIESDLFKARTHKYVKRTGTSGNYKYWYKLPDGRLVAEDHQQAMGRLDHVKRLLAGRMAGKHAMTDQQIEAETGETKAKVNSAKRNMARGGRNIGGRNYSHGHDYSEEHLLEPHQLADASHPTADSRPVAHDNAESSTSHTASPAPRARRPRRPRASVTTSSDTDAGEGSQGHTPQPEPTPAASPEPTPDPAATEIERLLAKLSPETRSKLSGENRRPAPAPAKQRPSEMVVDSRAVASDAIQRAARNRAADPSSAAAVDLHRVAPELAVADEPIQAMVETQSRGGNPYLERAKNIFHNIQADIKEERRNKVKHMLQAIEAVGATQSRTALLAKYKELSGNDRVRTLPEDDFEKGTFHTLEEVIANAPLDIEVERMKRGFAAKQFARMKPFLKNSWVQAHPSAPPPMPTYGDIKSWSEHGGTKPSWAGTTRMAVPKEVHDAAHKGADGKPKHPPAWMPIHLAPVWKYVMAKTGDDSAYQARGTGISPDQTSSTGFKLNMGSQAGFQEGMVINAMRKYIQMRGGADQLVDIPSSKLSEVNLTHSDIFKSDDLSDRAIKKIIKHKIVDPVGLIPFLKKEIKSGKPVKKSFSLVIGTEIPVFKPQSLVKAELISKIKELKQKGKS